MAHQSQSRSMMVRVGLFAALAVCVLPAMPATAADSGMPAPGQPNAQLPTFPQRFEIRGPEVASFGFAVTQPGPVVVEIQSQGVPVIATLQGAASQPLSQQGSGAIRLSYLVTLQDVQNGPFGRVQIRLAQQAPLALGGRAEGTINIQYPPVNQAALDQGIRSRSKQRRVPSEQEQQQANAQLAAKMESDFQQHKTQFERQQADRRASLHAQLQPQLDQLRGRMSGVPGQPSAWTKGGGSPVGSLPGNPVLPRGVDGPDAAEASSVVEGSTSESGASAEGEVGTRALQLQRIQKVLPLAPAPAPPPAIATLSVGQGQPGDPVMITGSGFGTGGEVHFVIAPGKDIVAPAAAIWSDTQIFTTVPDASGVLGFNGTVYIRRPADNINSNLVPFRFNPALELRQISRMMEVQLQQFNGVTAFNMNSYVRRTHGYMFWGPTGNDQIYMNARLKNGWVVSQPPSVYMPRPEETDGGVYVEESHVGTDRPHMNVRFWVDCWASNMLSGGSYPMVDYSISMLIQGPKGVPDGLVVP